jgi:serine/threonine protein kinase
MASRPTGQFPVNAVIQAQPSVPRRLFSTTSGLSPVILHRVIIAARSCNEMIGKRVAHFEISAKLGEGGMGAVYRALDTKLNRPVAIKFLCGDLADAAARRRFQREAQMALR